LDGRPETDTHQSLTRLHVVDTAIGNTSRNRVAYVTGWSLAPSPRLAEMQTGVCKVSCMTNAGLVQSGGPG
jgi:hypothetical protein